MYSYEQRRILETVPLVAFSSSLHAVLEEIGGEVGAFLLVAVGTRSKLVGVALRCGLKGLDWNSGPSGHGRGIHIVVVSSRLSRSTSSPGPLAWRRPSSILLSSGSASEVLVRELVGETRVGVVGSRSIGSLLITTALVVGVVAHGLTWVLRSVLVRREVTLWSVALSIGLLLLLLVLHAGGSARCWEDGLGKRRGGGGIGVAIGSSVPVVVAGKVEE